MTPPDDGNDRVTRAEIKKDIASLTELVKEVVVTQLVDHEDRLRKQESWSTTGKERWRSHGAEHDQIAQRNRIYDGVFASAAAAIGIIFQRN